ncbi:CvpA family protein [Pleionea sp. CnH1-48]|uniref:CvpA family protein n=1 Tax=Pleionea sp. CnH1-48 TaxID=2954494 RepID=UPI002097FEED|nr:CvpA family protein [Pleionea sp. CnH1-48]MCO7224278.1 CvpA family protein [Pleionea sp. CnH1-48]
MALPHIIFIAVVLVMTYRGYRSGLAGMFVSILGLASAYAAAWLLTPSVAAWLENSSQFRGMLALFISGAAIFMLTHTLVVAIASRLLVKEDSRGNIPGAILGLGIGSVLGLVAIWLLSFVQGLLPGLQPQETQAPNQLETFAKKQVAGWVSGALKVATKDNELAQASASLLARPDESLKNIKQLTQDPALSELFRNPKNQSILSRGDVAQVQSLPAFKALANNPELVALAENSGLLKPGQEIEPLLANKVTDMWLRYHQIQQDPEIQNLLQNPEFQRMLQTGNAFEVMNSDALSLLLEKIQQAPGLEAVIQQAKQRAKSPSQVYRWVDDKGVVHYSDKEPPEGQ